MSKFHKGQEVMWFRLNGSRPKRVHLVGVYDEPPCVKFNRWGKAWIVKQSECRPLRYCDTIDKRGANRIEKLVLTLRGGDSWSVREFSKKARAVPGLKTISVRHCLNDLVTRGFATIENRRFKPVAMFAGNEPGCHICEQKWTECDCFKDEP